MTKYKKIVVGELQVNCYLVYSENSGKCFIVDPGDESERIIEEVKIMGLTPESVVLTHGHMDHCGGVVPIQSEFGVGFRISEADIPVLNSEMNRELAESLGLEIPKRPDSFISPGMIIGDGDLRLEVIGTPGHSPGSVCFKSDNLLFSGDTLFSGSIGRTDLPGGDFKQIKRSLDKLRLLSPETTILPGHGESTSLDNELQYNPFM